MSDTWGNLKEGEKSALRSGMRRFSDSELEDRFAERDERVVFKIERRTERAMAGVLDIDVTREEPPETRIGEVGVDYLAAEEPAPTEVELPGTVVDDIESETEVVEITLISPDDFDYEPEITAEDKKAAKAIDKAAAKFKPYFKQDAVPAGEMTRAPDSESEAAGLPSIVDRRADQSPVKNQAGRGTCVAHASMGLLESPAHIPDDLSEQCTHYKFNEFLNRPHNVDSGLRTTDAAPFLARSDGRVCHESEWPYIPQQSTINNMVNAGTYNPPIECQQGTYGYGAYKIITDQGLTGESIKNTRYLEALLYQGYNVVIGTWVSWDDKDNNGVLDPVLDSNGNPVGRGGHAMLVVGYNRPQQYFIVKNSWGAGWGHSGYAYLHYNLVRSCFKYGFVVHDVVPAAPTALPKRLATAPFSTAKISRSQLRAAILFIKTSAGRFAVTEAYAGYNLYLRNLRVYNPDGTVHLERPELVIRGTYLADIDSGRETSSDADFWWEAVRPGVNYLVPRNGAAACIGYNLAALTPWKIGTLSLSDVAVPSENLNYAVIAGTTTANRRFKILAHMKDNNRLQLSYLAVYTSSGYRIRYATKIMIPSSWTYNLDTLQLGGGQWADIWWHVVSDTVGFLETYSTARGTLVWKL